jgi:signal transduction histidine kinase
MLEDATLDLLKFESFPSLAAAIEATVESALARWQIVVREKLPTADELTLVQLRDELPRVLRELARTIAAENGAHFAVLKELAKDHGQLRFHQSFDVGELLVEYGILRPIVLDEVSSHLGRHLTVPEAAVLNMGIDTVVRNGVTRFTAYQQQQMKAVVDAQSKNLSFLSHDIRGGLNGVLLMVEVLKRELAGEPKFSDSIQDLDSMRQSILDTVGTMDRFLHAERFRQGKVQPHNTTISLAPLLSELVTHFRHQAEAKGLKISTAVPSPLTAFTDRDLLVMILQNFSSNAIKYTTTGSVELRADKLANRKLRISVTDTGPGIAPERVENLFAPFTRGETHGQEGVGLGLSIAKQAADLISASITIDSKLGTGSTFSLDLP